MRPIDHSSSANPGEHAKPGTLPPALDCWYLAGPTASGKTGVGLELARLLDAEVISLDSMAVYRGMDIGTAKPSAVDRQRIPHHLIDIMDPSEEFSVWQYATIAHQQIEEIRRRGRTVLFIGGTPMYLKAMLRGLFQGPPADWEFRINVEREARQVGIEVLHDRLNQVDPLSAAKLHPHDTRRIIRALEVYKITGQPLSHYQMQFEEGVDATDCRVFVLGWHRSALHERIDRRVEEMFRIGLVDEVVSLTAAPRVLGRTAAQAVGYREVVEHVNGQISLSDTVTRVKARTHQFARRQETWFRSLSECRRIDHDPQVETEQVAQRLWELGLQVSDR